MKILNLRCTRLSDWAEKAVKPGGIIERMADSHFKVNTATPELARLKSGFLIKEMMERFTQKIFRALEPDRSLWLYSAHDETIANVLNSLGLFEVWSDFFGIILWNQSNVILFHVFIATFSTARVQPAFRTIQTERKRTLHADLLSEIEWRVSRSIEVTWLRWR